MILEAMSVMKRHDSAIALVEFISDELNSNKWHSTQTPGLLPAFHGKIYRAFKQRT